MPAPPMSPPPPEPAAATPAPGMSGDLPPEASSHQDGPAPDVPARSTAAEPVEVAPAVTQQFQDAAVVPAWVAASERFVDSGIAELLNSGATSAMSVPEKQSYQEGAARALQEVRQMVARHAGRS